jgi:hypothetical protein
MAQIRFAAIKEVFSRQPLTVEAPPVKYPIITDAMSLIMKKCGSIYPAMRMTK